MRFDEFVQEVWEACKGYGQPYIPRSEPTRLNALVERQLLDFTLRAPCIYADEADVTFAEGIAVYDERDTLVFEFAMAKVTRVYVDGLELQKRADPPEFDRLLASGRPDSWWRIGEHRIRVSRPPALASFTGATCAGWRVEPSHSSPSASILVPDEHIEAAKRHCAIALLEPAAGGESEKKSNRLIALDEAAIARIQAEVEDRDQTRGYRRGVSYGCGAR